MRSEHSAGVSCWSTIFKKANKRETNYKEVAYPQQLGEKANFLPEMETHMISLYCIWIINVYNFFYKLGIQEGSCWRHVWHHNASSF